MRDQPVSEVDCIPQRLHRQRSLFKPWEIEEIGNRPQADDQVIIGKLVMVMVEAVRYGHELAFQIDGFNLSCKKTDPLQELPHGVHDVREIEITGSNLMQHGSEQKEIVPVD